VHAGSASGGTSDKCLDFGWFQKGEDMLNYEVSFVDGVSLNSFMSNIKNLTLQLNDNETSQVLKYEIYGDKKDVKKCKKLIKELYHHVEDQSQLEFHEAL
jgi:hypothetical protein